MGLAISLAFGPGVAHAGTTFVNVGVTTMLDYVWVDHGTAMTNPGIVAFPLGNAYGYVDSGLIHTSGTALSGSAHEESRSWAFVSYTTNLYFTGPGNGVMESANLWVDGTTTILGNAMYDNAVNFTVGVYNTQFESVACSGGDYIGPPYCGMANLTNGLLVTSPVWVQTYRPVTVQLGMDLHLSAGGDFGGGEAQADYSETLSFNPYGPAFNLPDGYTVNSDDGLIVDNHFVGWPAGSSAPEPATGMLLLPALMALAAFRARR